MTFFSTFELWRVSAEVITHYGCARELILAVTEVNTSKKQLARRIPPLNFSRDRNQGVTNRFASISRGYFSTFLNLSGLEDNFLSNKVGQRIKYEFKTFLRCRRYLHRKQEIRINFIWKRHSIYLNGSTPGHSLALWRMDGTSPETITWLQWRSFKDKDVDFYSKISFRNR